MTGGHPERGPNREVLIISVTPDGRYALHPPSRRPDYVDPTFNTLAEAEAFLAGGSAVRAGAGFEVDLSPSRGQEARPSDDEVELLTVESAADGSVIVTGVVEGCTMRATVRGDAVEIDPRDLEDAGVDLESVRGQRAILLWTDYLSRRVEGGDLGGAMMGDPGLPG